MQVQITLNVVRETTPTGVVIWKVGGVEGLEVLRAIAVHDCLAHRFLGYRVPLLRQHSALNLYFRSVEHVERVLEIVLGRLKFIGTEDLTSLVYREIRIGVEEGSFPKWDN